ncbi:MAG: hypothetical protein NXI22_09120, partial [bacterium]|nr:hypothetical protein [bacterium]
MELKRTHYLMIGLVLLFVGVQFRLVEGFVMNKSVSGFMADHLDSKPKGVAVAFTQVADVPQKSRTLSPPRWLAWTFISLGAVMTVYSFALPKNE